MNNHTQSFDFKKLLPHLVIIGIMAVIAFIYCYPVLQGKVLTQGDVMSWQGTSHEVTEWDKKTGENSMWSNSMFSGMPTFTYYLKENGNYVSKAQAGVQTIFIKPVYYFFIAMVCFYILMCTLRINRWLGLIGAIAYAFATYNPVIIIAGHDSKMMAIAYVPLLLSSTIITYRGNYLYGGILSCIAFSLFAWEHLQIVYYMIFVMLFLVIALFFIALKKKQLKQFFIASAVTLVAYIIGIGPSVCTILPVQEYTKYTMRGGQSELSFNHDKEKTKTGGGLDKDYAFAWSNGVGETFAMMIPYLYGGSSSEPLEKAPKTAEILSNAGYASVPLYWGPQDLGISGPMYSGAIICFLFVLGIMVVRNPLKWWIVIVSALFIMLSWGKNFPMFNYFLFDHLPFYNKFRTPSMALSVAQMLLPILAIWCVWDIMNGKVPKDELLRKLKIAAGITAGLCVLIAFGGSMFFDFTNHNTEAKYPKELLTALKEDRVSLAMESALKSAGFILLAAAVIWAFIKDKIKANVLMIAIGALIAIDLFSVDRNYLNEDSFQDAADYEQAFEPRPVDRQIMEDKDPYYRVLDLSRNVYNDAIQAYFHKCIGGYSAAKLEIYQDLIDVHMSKKFNSQVLNMLNTKYIIFNGGPNNSPVAQANPDANGNAWFVNEIKWAKNADEEILSLNAPALGDTVHVDNPFDSRKTAVVRETYSKDLNGYKFGKDSSAKVALTKYGLNNIYFQSNNSQDGLAVFSDIYYKDGWKAYIDGKETPIIRANYVLRALKVPAGMHKIEFHFKPKTYEVSYRISLISSILVYGLAITALILLFRGKKPVVNVED